VLILDLIAGLAFLVAAVTLRQLPSLAVLAAAGGLLWLAGDLVQPLVFAHRAPLTQLLLLYPEPRFRSRMARALVLVLWVASLAEPLGRLPVVTGLCLILVVAASRSAPRAEAASPGGGSATGVSEGVTGRITSAMVGRAGAVVVWGLLTAHALAMLAGAPADQAFLAAYDVAVIAAVAAVVADHRLRRSQTVIVSNLVIDLKEGGTRSVRDAVAEALGDESVRLGLLTQDGCVDERGFPVALQPARHSVITDLWDGNDRIAVLHHDPALLRDRQLLDSVTALAAVALANTRLQQEVMISIEQVAASRRRLLAAADAERDRLERELQQRVLSRLDAVAAQVGSLGSSSLCSQVQSTRETIRSFARGVYPRALDECGIAALRSLGPVGPRLVVDLPTDRFPSEIEAAAYFLCVEAVTNTAHHAHAETVRVCVTPVDETLVVEVADDGIGGVDLSRGSGLTGLRDRLDALGGSLAVRSTASGTVVRGVIPLTKDSSPTLAES
jgi:signal transduction histidine kinase